MESGTILSSSDLMKLADDRISVFRKRDLPEHLSLLKAWERKLKALETWYRSTGENFEKFADNLRHEHLVAKERNIPLNVIYHDHSYCLRAYRKSKHIFVPHECKSYCDASARLPDDLSTCSPLELPLRLRWQRVLLQHCEDSGLIDCYYIAPCGRKLRNMAEVKYFLDMTEGGGLTGIHFTFDPLCSLTSVQFDVEGLVISDDISGGKESKPVSCVNAVNRDLPDCMTEKFEYLTTRTFEPNILHEAKPEFLVCCSCTDNCTNRSKCECWQLTQEEAKVLGNVRYSVGYVHHRLKRPQHSAVYECNSRCSCGEGCSNRVVQGGVQHRLQLFHTGVTNLNWGLRTLDDIPMGTFICSYIGHVYTEMSAEKKAVQHGDEYFADLDYIEVMEHHKAGYEFGAVMSEDETSSLSSETNNRRLRSQLTNDRTSSRRFSRHRKPTIEDATNPDVLNISSSEDESDPISSDSSNLSIAASKETDSSRHTPADQTSPLHPQDTPVLNYQLTSTTSSRSPKESPKPLQASGSSPPDASHHSPTPTGELPPPRPLKTRRYYMEDFNYIIDAKSKGNMARYINHSCNPNLFVQNVFVDTHDLRFPWVAFFAKRRIKAMEELRWDYNYEIGSVKNKKILCLCGAPNCRRRLL